MVVDTSIHLHEGLDIPALTGDTVYAVKAGKIEAIYRSAFAPSSSVLVIRDLAGNRGWNYKHVIADAMRKVGDTVNEGAAIGTVAPFPGIYPPHVHLDRGEAPAVVPVGDLRDESWLKLQVYEQLREGLAAALRVLKSPTATITQLTQAGIVVADSSAALEVLRWHYSPLINPLSEFTGTPAYQDVLEPTIESIAFRVASDDDAERFRETLNPSSEIRRTNARYFNTTVVVNNIGNQPLTRLGVQSSALAQNSRASEAGQDDEFKTNASIDFVVRAFDQYATAGNTSDTQLNPSKFEFRVSGRKWATTNAYIPA